MLKRNIYYTSIGQPRNNNWWLPTGLNSANCIAAYKAIGASSYSTSLLNLADPTKYTLVKASTADPDWSSDLGWKGVTNGYLKTNITSAVVGEWSILVKYSSAPTGAVYLFGSVEGNKFWFANVDYSNQIRYGLGNTTKSVAPKLLTGVVGFSAMQPYRNGSKDGTAFSITPATPSNVLLLCAVTNTTAFTGYIQAVAIYNTALSEAQMCEVTDSMEGL